MAEAELRERAFRAPAPPRTTDGMAERELGRVRGSSDGPTLIVVGAMHGNEPAGLVAAGRVLDRLAGDAEGLRGELVALIGNVAARAEGRRYGVKDLNRQWSLEGVEALRTRDPATDDAEDAEQRGLLAAIDEAIARARGPVFLMDLHTTSAAGVPFVLFGDTLAQRAFASALPLPILLGLEEQIDGVMSAYFTTRGCISIAIEGGQHDDPGAIDNLESALYLGLVAAGLCDEPALAAECMAARTLLEARRGALPHVMEVVSRHAIRPSDEFRMEPGFANLAPASRGQLLARDRRGAIRAPHDGMVILPLYQGQGEDGFFWGRPMSPRRLRATALLRELGVERILPLLPGVTREASQGGERLRVAEPMASGYPRALFHALGYRRIRERDGALVVERPPQR